MSERDELETLRRIAELEAKSGGGRHAYRAESMEPQDLRIAQTKNDPFGEYLRAQAAVPKPGESQEQLDTRLYGKLTQDARPGTGEGMARAGLQGFSFAGGDELVAGGTALMDSAIRGDDFGEAYDYRVAQERNKLNQFRDDEPVLAYGTEIAGAIPSAMAGPVNLARAGQWGNAIGTGMLQGGLYGYGQGEGDALDQIQSTAIGATAGGTLGAAGVPIAKGVGNLANKYMTKKAAEQAGMSGDQYNIVMRAMSADDALTGAGQQRLLAAGDDAMLADSGSGAQRLIDAAMVESPPAARMATAAIEGRATDASHKLTGVLDDQLGAPQGLNSAARDIAQNTKAARGDAYDAAYSRPIDYSSGAGRNIEAALDRVPNRVLDTAIKTANERMTAKGLQNQQILVNVAEDGTVSFREMPNVRQLDQIKRVLGEMGAEGIDQFGRQTSDGNMYSTLARSIKRATADAVPEYSAAVRLGGDKIERDLALRLGSDLLSKRTTREAVRDAAEDMSDDARAEAARGLRSYIDEKLANVQAAMTDTNLDAREAWTLVKDMSSRANREKIQTLLGDDASQAIFSQLDESMKAFELRAAVAKNSATAVRQSTAQGVKDVVEGGVINRVREGQPLQTGKGMVAAILGRSPEAKQKISDELYMGMVEALTGPRGNEALKALEHLQTVQPLIDQGTGKVMDIVSALMSRNAPVSSQMNNALGAN
tara:strand:- start:2050 stop:4179 length:2130 start_codon:yes stop_codon:yes gene_type:complete